MPTGKVLDVIVDLYGSDMHHKVQAWVTHHPHFTPTSAQGCTRARPSSRRLGGTGSARCVPFGRRAPNCDEWPYCRAQRRSPAVCPGPTPLTRSSPRQSSNAPVHRGRKRADQVEGKLVAACPWSELGIRRSHGSARGKLLRFYCSPTNAFGRGGREVRVSACGVSL